MIHIDQVASSTLCPVQAWRLYYALISPPPSGPAFIHLNGFPMTANPVVSAMRAALKAAGYFDVNRYSMHSLRRGAAQLVSSLGAPTEDIMQHRVWASRSGLSHYLNPVSTTVPGLWPKVWLSDCVPYYLSNQYYMFQISSFVLPCLITYFIYIWCNLMSS